MEAPLNLERLIKVLALADSTVDGEALAALRLAQQMLGSRGLTFADLGAALVQAETLVSAQQKPRAEIDASRGIIKAYEIRIVALERENALIRKDMAAAERMIERWKNIALSHGRDSAKFQAAAEKWHGLARNTAEHLWELGRQLQAIDEPSPPETPPDDTFNPTNDAAGLNVVRFSGKKR